MGEVKHIPVLLEESIGALNVKRGDWYIDGTLGRGGHTSEIIRRGGKVLGIDRDDQALEETKAMGLEGLVAVKGRHGDLCKLAKDNGIDAVEGILLDLGISSPQLDEAERGFSFLREGPLDMRMDQTGAVTAADLVNTESVERLEEAFRIFGEEPQARRIAKAIVAERVPRPFLTTKALALFVERLLGYRGAHHPATKVFQALRMAVNDEVGELEKALEGGMEILAPGGRFVVITFESITDRIVKQFFSSHVGREVSLQQGGQRWEGKEPRAMWILKRAVKASEREVAANPRARSAKLRAIEKAAA